MYNQVISLIKKVNSVNEYGDTVSVEIAKEVFVEIKSIGMKEKYQALSVGLEPELTFILADYYDYDDETSVEFEGKKYTVIRTYQTKDNTLELVVARDGNT